MSLEVVSFILLISTETNIFKSNLLILAESPHHSLTVDLLVTHHSQMLLNMFSWHHHHHNHIINYFSNCNNWHQQSLVWMTGSQVRLTLVIQIFSNKIFDVKISSLSLPNHFVISDSFNTSSLSITLALYYGWIFLVPSSLILSPMGSSMPDFHLCLLNIATYIHTHR